MNIWAVGATLYCFIFGRVSFYDMHIYNKTTTEQYSSLPPSSSISSPHPLLTVVFLSFFLNQKCMILLWIPPRRATERATQQKPNTSMTMDTQVFYIFKTSNKSINKINKKSEEKKKEEGKEKSII